MLTQHNKKQKKHTSSDQAIKKAGARFIRFIISSFSTPSSNTRYIADFRSYTHFHNHHSYHDPRIWFWTYYPGRAQSRLLCCSAKTPTKSIAPYAPVSPYSDDSPSSTASRSILTPPSPARARLQKPDSFTEIGNRIVMSDHKRAEIEGRFKEEPLLKDNPGRFVLFPIQDADVSEIKV